MKSSHFKLFLVFSLLLFTGTIFSQEKKILSNDCLWIKSKSSSIDSSSNASIENEFEKYFNFNPVVAFSKDEVKQKYKNLVTKKSSVFVVFKSISKEENDLFLIERGLFQLNVSNQKIVCDEEIPFQNKDAKKGILLSYLFNKNSLIGKKNGNLIFNDLLYEDKEHKNQLAELIYFPRIVAGNEKEAIESYLSIKYGISLDADKNYINSKKDTLWNTKENGGYNHRVTAMGRDDFFGLYQKQSKNSLNDGLTIGIDKVEKSNAANVGELLDGTFLMWGDNDKKCSLEENSENSQKRMKRIWTMKTNSTSIVESYKTQIIIDKSLMQLEIVTDEREEDFIWLAIDSLNSSAFNYENAKYIKATVNDDKKIIFDDVTWNSNSNYRFTIVKAPEKEKEKNMLVPGISIEDIQLGTTNNYNIYPNPADNSEDFSIQFTLKEPSKASVKITDISGKIIRNKDLGTIQEFTYKDTITTIGTYLVLVTINGTVETSKLIVK